MLFRSGAGLGAYRDLAEKVVPDMEEPELPSEETQEESGAFGEPASFDEEESADFAE